MSYLNAAFWQVQITVSKESSFEIEDFFLRSGAISTYELLYAEGRPSNLTEENTELFFFFTKTFPARAFTPMALATLGFTHLPFSVSEVKYSDYLKEFEKTFRAFALTQKTALVPPWDENNPEVNENFKRLFLIPGMAFGTGKHATTQLMIEFIEENVRPTDTAIDMGCGSGILALAALLHGAKEVYGVDVETLAIESAHANLELNQKKYEKQYDASFTVGDFSTLSTILLKKETTLFLANILPNIFEANREALQSALAESRAWALSGIPIEQEAKFTAFLKTITETNFQIRRKEDWLMYSASE